MAYPKKDIDFSSFDNAVKETPASSLDFSSFDNVVKKKKIFNILLLLLKKIHYHLLLSHQNH